ncbi:hypothetical protein BDV93DRAFT_510292 [Ceratobasidium sp. AG-I]|nr:hypothetical protein BDV93DRAFT_510292 [Ceratobasidium sp. AG-I]
MATTADPTHDEAFLTKTAEAFDTAASDTFTAAENHDQDGQKLAEDMYQVFVSFKSSSTKLGVVDSDYGSKWKEKWDPLSGRYGKNLEQAKAIAIKGEDYINNFNTNVAKRFSVGASDVKNDVKILKDWLDVGASKLSTIEPISYWCHQQANEDDRELKSESQQISQDFLDLSNEVTALRDTFSTFANQKGATYQSDLDKMQRDVKSLQDQISWEDSAAAEAQRTADGLVGTLAVIGGIFESFFTGGHSPVTVSQSILARHKASNETLNIGLKISEFLPRIYLELRREKDRLAAEAKKLAKEKSYLHDVQNALTILAHDVIDVCGRLGKFATLWAVAHSSFLELRGLFDGLSTTHSATFFRLRVKVVASSTVVFAKDMKRFSDALVYIGSAQIQRAYKVSPQFGGSDITRGILFNDARDLDLDFDRPIVSVVVTSGWVVDGIKNGSTRTVAHGTTGYSSDVTLTINDNEYISAATGKSGHAGNGEPWMGDCVQQLELRITNSVTGAQRTYGPYGTARGLSADSTTMIPWSGRLIAFAGSADNNAGQVGLRGIAFVKSAT